ncbi:hypothetical protein [Pseudonocardia humida]|uniref:Uncharacterized protein n=1 Tax=Pseudonocardia humida TaxID=2800819 RepID=A0ABT0ZVB5_9PSEU|nr:hypothetical protein [Pseudonocardia humida]MCO1654676.1 hypothetical protein [Pseudonocardia humida]
MSSAAPPPAALPAGEGNRFLVAFAAAVVEGWSLTRAEPVARTGDLATCLWALDRGDEALRVALAVTAVITEPPPLGRAGRPDMAVWAAALGLHALEARLHRLAGRAADGAAAAARIRAHPALADAPRFLNGLVREAPALYAGARAEPVTAHGCGIVARRVRLLMVTQEFAASGGRRGRFLDPAGAQVQVDAGLAVLREVLERAR